MPFSVQPQRESEYQAGDVTPEFETIESELPEPTPVDADVDLDKETRIRRLPAVDTSLTRSRDFESADIDEASTDGSQFYNVELDGIGAYPEALSDPLRGHPLWEQNGPARPQLYGDAASQSAP
jgi:hypothetical protein